MCMADCCPLHVTACLCSCREYVLAFAIWDETSSFLADRNIERFLPKLARNASGTEELKKDEKFKESNLMHGVNG